MHGQESPLEIAGTRTSALVLTTQIQRYCPLFATMIEMCHQMSYLFNPVKVSLGANVSTPCRLSENSVFDHPPLPPFLAWKGYFESGGNPQTPFLGAPPPENPHFRTTSIEGVGGCPHAPSKVAGPFMESPFSYFLLIVTTPQKTTTPKIALSPPAPFAGASEGSWGTPHSAGSGQAPNPRQEASRTQPSIVESPERPGLSGGGTGVSPVPLLPPSPAGEGGQGDEVSMLPPLIETAASQPWGFPGKMPL